MTSFTDQQKQSMIEMNGCNQLICVNVCERDIKVTSKQQTTGCVTLDQQQQTIQLRRLTKHYQFYDYAHHKKFINKLLSG
uniref:Uncharacterized protein n=1 Tax=Arion vulgaris TaxID=1028688 RepID=A0A0B7ACA9_9EUPU